MYIFKRFKNYCLGTLDRNVLMLDLLKFYKDDEKSKRIPDELKKIPTSWLRSLKSEAKTERNHVNKRRLINDIDVEINRRLANTKIVIQIIVGVVVIVLASLIIGLI